MTTQTFTNPDGSTATFVVPDPLVELQDQIVTTTGNMVTVVAQPPAVTIGTPSYSWTPAPTPAAKATSRTLVGDTPRGVSDAAGVAAADDEYGEGEAIRLYCTGPLLAPAVTDRFVVGSFKTITSVPTMKATSAGYDVLFEQHEADAKWVKAAANLTGSAATAAKAAWLKQWRSDMSLLVADGIPNLGICLTADAFVNTAKNPADFLVPHVAHLGVDFDGISPKATSTAYHDYTAELSAVLKFLKANPQITSWGVPEFGANRGVFDPDGSQRSAWLVHWVKAFRDAGAQYVCLWEQDAQAGSTFTTPVEIATIRTMFALAS